MALDIEKLLEQSVEDINETVKLLSAYQHKEITPLSSGIDHLDKMCLGGLYPDLIVAIGARSANGKSYTLNRIRKSILSNPDDIGVLFYNLEMPFLSLLLIELKKELGKPLKYLMNNPPTAEELPYYKNVTNQFRDPRLTKIDRTMSPEDFYRCTKTYIEKNLHRKQIFVLLDHIGIISGTNKVESIHQTMEYINMLKLEYPRKLTFIVLCQLNRSVEEKMKPGVNPLNRRLSSSDIYSSDSILFFADIVMGQIIPQIFNLKEFCSVRRDKYPHLEEHVYYEDIMSPKDYVRLNPDNRVYYDYLKVRLEDGESRLYCEIISKEVEEYSKTVSQFEKNADESNNIEELQF